MNGITRLLSPRTNLTGLLTAAAAVYALADGIWNVAHHHGALAPQVITAGIGAIAFLVTRFTVTPVADPKDGAGRTLTAAGTTAAGQVKP